MIRGALESVVAGRVWRGHHKRPLLLWHLALGERASCAIVGSPPFLRHSSFLALFAVRGAAPWRRLETLHALHPPSPTRPTRWRTTKSPQPSATGPRKRVGSIRRRRRSSPRRTSAARARRGNPVGLRLDNVRAQATPRPTTHTSSSTRITRTAWCTASSVSRSP